MIPFDFSYYRCETLDEAATIYKNLTVLGKIPAYYGGGTELISMARAGSIKFDAVIDIKNISACAALYMDASDLIIGSAVTLTQIAESGYFPLLSETVSRIADHTIQGKITLGGNIAGTIIYREAALPLLITNSRVKIMNENGMREIPFSTVFDGRIDLQKGDLIVQILIDKNDLRLPYNHVKRTKIEKIDYPLFTLAAIKKDNAIYAAVSGLPNGPSLLPNAALNDINMSAPDRINNTVAAMQDRIATDLSGSKEYRIFVLRTILNQMLHNLKGASSC